MKKFSIFSLVTLLSLFFVVGVSFAQELDPAYIKVTQERAGKIVSNLDLADAGRAEKVQGYIASQYQNLSIVHDERDRKMKEVKEKYSDKKRDKKIKSIDKNISKKLNQLHSQFIKQLDSELSADQVVQVKDGMTYNVAPNTFKVYQEMVPDLTDDQKEKIWNWLVEAREQAMDAGTSHDKHAVFGKYKGRINNYLSSLGIDMKQAEKDMYKRQQSRIN